MKRSLSLALVATALVVIPAGSALAHGLVDQSFDETADGARSTLNGFTGLAQTFVPTADTLTSVDLLLGRQESLGDADVQVSIRDGGPEGALLGSTEGVVSSARWYHFEFPSTIELTPGNTYAIRLDSVSGNPRWSWRFTGLGPPSYDYGSMFECATACNEHPTLDFLFRTYFYVDGDGDGDGVLYDDDLCSDTEPDAVHFDDLQTQRHYAYYGGTDLVSGRPNGVRAGTFVPPPVFTMTDTGGCSGEQIIEALDLGGGHLKNGLSLSALRTWVEWVALGDT